MSQQLSGQLGGEMAEPGESRATGGGSQNAQVTDGDP